MFVHALALASMPLTHAADSRGTRAAAIVAEATDDPVVLREVRRLVDDTPQTCGAMTRFMKRVEKKLPVDSRVFVTVVNDDRHSYCDHRNPNRNVVGRREEGEVMARFGGVSPALAGAAHPAEFSVALMPTDGHPLEMWGADDARGVVHQAIARGLVPGILQTELDDDLQSHVLVEIPIGEPNWRDEEGPNPDLYLVATPSPDGSIAQLEYIYSPQFSRDVASLKPYPVAVLDGDDAALARLTSWWEHRSGLVCMMGCDQPERVGALMGQMLSEGRLVSATGGGEAGRSGRFFLVVFDEYPDVPHIAVYGDWDDLELRTGRHPTFVLDGDTWREGQPMVYDAELGVLLSGPNPLGLDTLPGLSPEKVTVEDLDEPISRFSPSNPSSVRNEDGRVGQLPGGRQQTTLVDWVEVPPGFSRLPAVDSERALSYIWGTRSGPLVFLGVKGNTVTVLRRHRFDLKYRARDSSGYIANESGAAKLDRVGGSRFDHLLVFNGSDEAGELGYRSLRQESDEQWAVRRQRRNREIAEIRAERDRARAARAAQPRPRRTLMEQLIEQRDRFYTEVTVTNSGTSRCAVSVYPDGGAVGGASGSFDLAPGASETFLVDVSSSSYAVGSATGCHDGVGVR